MRHLEMALKAPSIPPEILQILLNLAEFMEHDDKPLPIDIKARFLFSSLLVCVHELTLFRSSSLSS